VIYEHSSTAHSRPAFPREYLYVYDLTSRIARTTYSRPKTIIIQGRSPEFPSIAPSPSPEKIPHTFHHGSSGEPQQSGQEVERR